MTKSTSTPLIDASPAPWDLQANQSDHGETSVICDPLGTVVCSIPSPVWDKSAALRVPQDSANARLLLAAPAMLKALVEAEKALFILTEEHEQETEKTEAGGWATDALTVVREAIRAASYPKDFLALFRVSTEVVISVKDIMAYDTEAAQRHVRESLEDVREDIVNTEIDLGFLDGETRKAIIRLPADLDADASLVSGQEEDPEDNMEHGVFEIEVPASVEFNIKAPVNAAPAEVIARANSLLSGSDAIDGVAFEGIVIGATIKLASPLHISLVEG